MKRYVLITVLLCVGTILNAQPGPRYENLNDGIFDVIIIDSTTNLSRVALLKDMRNLNLIIQLPKIPVEFKNFVHTESLTITIANDLSDLVYFPNLKSLSIHSYLGKEISPNNIQLDSLQSLYISDAKNLERMDAFSENIAIERLFIQGTPNLIRFPKFAKNNRIKELKVDHGITFRKNYGTNYLKAIKHLSRLNKLTLANIYSITEVPSYLPVSIQYLEINSWALHNRTTKITNLRHLNKLKNLEELRLYAIELDSVETTFPNLSLKGLYLDRVQNLKDVSWVFTFDAIEHLRIRNCNDLYVIEGNLENDNISEIDINKANNLTSIDFLFKLTNLKFLEVRNCSKLIVPSTDVMYKIPHIMMAGTKYHFYRENYIWELIEYYD
ncbi:hypothetical protein IMCC3317_35950 [Kordia antarctica]|uniref:Internalin-A n=2 Tax=Kordia antarctica TaxID=1218801 RepID=A0A7L4ZNA0_9FLAO|nr:hypothetical protein IMCC3317_35950 [Kordia antarctica]